MFKENPDNRLSNWAKLRKTLEDSDSPLVDAWEFWKPAPFIPYNKNIDPYHKQSWPTPWEIIVENKYDDFTKSLMIAWTLKLTNKFQDSKIEIKTLLDKSKPTQYNIVCIDNLWAINYDDNGPVELKNLPDSFLIENIVELEVPR